MPPTMNELTYLDRATALRYAEQVDRRPHNAFYERPATLSLLPSLAGKRVLDAGCGAGWYTEYLLAQGATVTAIDASPHLVSFTRERVRGQATVLQADLRQPLTFAADRSFDLVVSSLVLHYLADMGPTLAEFRRILAPEGHLVFSVHHPCLTQRLFQLTDYFTVVEVEDEWPWLGKVRFYHHSLTGICQALAEASFVIEQLVEPRPVAAFKEVDPEGYARLLRNPGFLVIRSKPL